MADEFGAPLKSDRRIWELEDVSISLIITRRVENCQLSRVKDGFSTDVLDRAFQLA